MAGPPDNAGADQRPARTPSPPRDGRNGDPGIDAIGDDQQQWAPVGLIAAGIAHELNNLLTPAAGYLDMARLSPEDTELAQTAINKALHAIRSATGVAEAILGLGVQHDGSTCNIPEVVDAALNCLGRELKNDRVVLHLSVENAPPARIDPVTLQQVILNLILNARSVMRPTGGTLTISALPHSERTTLIRVADTGPGMPAEAIRRVYEPFAVSAEQAGPSRNGNSAPRQRGTGVGLALCNYLINQAGGRLQIESEPGRGTIVSLTLPAVATEHAKAG